MAIGLSTLSRNFYVNSDTETHSQGVLITYPDYTNNSNYAHFTEFKFSIRVQYHGGGSNYLTISGDYTSFNVAQNYQQGGSAQITFAVTNFDYLQPGQNLARIHFESFGYINGNQQLIESIYIPVNTFTPTQYQNILAASPESFTLRHVAGQPFEPQSQIQIQVTSNSSWEVRNDLEYLDITPTSGTGDAILNVSLNENADNLEVSTWRLASFKLYADLFTEVTVNFGLIILGQNNPYAVPNELNYEIIQGDEITEPTALEIFSLDTFDVVLPPIMSFHGVQLLAILGRYNVIPADTSQLEIGIHTSNIVVNTSSGVQFTIPVTIIVKAEFESPYKANKIYFSKEDIPIIKNTVNNNVSTYLEINLAASVFNELGESISKSDTFVASFFQGKAKFIPGELIHNWFKKLESEILVNNWYKPIDVNMTFNERQLFTKELVQSFSETINTKFIKGFRPYGQIEDKAVLLHSNNQKLHRAYANMKTLFNVFVNTNVLITILKNGNYIDSYLLTNTGSIQKFEYEFTGMLGDEYEFRFSALINNELTQTTEQKNIGIKRFKIFPSPIKLTEILFEDQHNCIKSFTAGGHYEVKNEYEHTTFTKRNKFVENIETLAVNRIQELNINTGFVLADDIRLLDELNKSRRAWLREGDNLVPILSLTKDLKQTNTKRQLSEFDLSLTIQKQNNAEVYPY